MQYQFKIQSFGQSPHIQLTLTIDQHLIGRFCCDGQTHDIIYVMDNNDDNIFIKRSFVLEMSGKNHSHTKVDEFGNVLSDCYFTIENLIFEDIDVTEEFCIGQSQYNHNNNDDSDFNSDKFFGVIGCNGIVTFDFKTPLHIWMLEKCQ